MSNQAKRKETFGIIWRVYQLAAPYKGYMAVSIILTLGYAYTAPLIPHLIQQAVDLKVAKGDLPGLIEMSAWIFGLYLLNTLMMLLRTWFTGILAQNVVRDLRNRVFNYISKLKLKYIDKTPVGTLITRNVSDIQTLSDFFTEGAVTITGDLLTIAFIMYRMFSADWQLTLVSLSVLPFLLVAAYIFKEKVNISFKEVRAQVQKLNAFVQEHLTGMQVVQLFGREKVEEERFSKINAAHRDANIKGVLYYSVFFPVVEIIVATAIGLIVWYAVNTVIIGKELGEEVSFGIVVSFIMYINMFFRPVRQIADRFNSMQMGVVSAERIFKLLDEESQIEKSGVLTTTINGDVRFDKVWFAYNDDHYVLKNISFEVKAGRTLALVGATGAGKSSVINLLSRFYDYNKGQVYLDHEPLENYDLFHLRRNIAVVMQDVFLFSGSILDNIRLFNPDLTDESAMEAARAIGAEGFILKLPGAYHYKVGERGGSLSAGQRQLISFARALASNPKILVLDEATANIDTETELIIQQATAILMKGRTNIVIAHRLSTIQHADEILVLNQGQIVEQGKHHELLSKNGVYSNMYKTQFEHLV